MAVYLNRQAWKVLDQLRRARRRRFLAGDQQIGSSDGQSDQGMRRIDDYKREARKSKQGVRILACLKPSLPKIPIS
jgi:hypothetical protein